MDLRIGSAHRGLLSGLRKLNYRKNLMNWRKVIPIPPLQKQGTNRQSRERRSVHATEAMQIPARNVRSLFLFRLMPLNQSLGHLCESSSRRTTPAILNATTTC